MYSGLLAAASITATVNGDVGELEARGFYESLYRNSYSRLLAMVAAVYRRYQGKASYFWLAQRLVRTGAPHRPDGRHGGHGNAFASITAGLSDLEDAGALGGTAPMHELVAAAHTAGLRATGGVPGTDATQAPMRMDAGDLYDAATGLYLVTDPALGIRRATGATGASPALTLTR